MTNPADVRVVLPGLVDGRVEVDADESVLADAGVVDLKVFPDRRNVLVANVHEVVGPQVWNETSAVRFPVTVTLQL